LSAVAPVMAATEDIYKDSAKILDELNILKGDEDGNLMLDKNLKRQDMVILISRLYKEEKEASVFKASNIFKDLNKDRAFYIPYINWAVKNGLIVGMGDNTFGFNESVTVQQFQTVLLRALGYTAEAKLWKDVPAYAKQLHIMDDLDLEAGNKLTRGQMAAMVLNTLRQDQKKSTTTLAEKLGLKIPDLFTVDSEVKVEINTITISGSVQGTDSLKLELKPISSGMVSKERTIDLTINSNDKFNETIKDLETGTYNYRFLSGNNSTKYESVTIQSLPFSLKSVEANNLKEIVLSFTQAVDKNTAGFVSNYTTTAGTIKDIRFEENDTKVILSLNSIMKQQGKYKITANTMKSVSGVEEKVKDLEFTTFDNQVPQALEVVQLGTKGLKIIFSEPIKSASSNNLKIDGNKVSGSLKVENNIITLTNYSNTLSESTHTLTVTGIEDYAGYKGLDQNIDFTIVKDTTDPTIKGASATLEEVIIEFSEDIDPVSAVKSNFYWKVGSSKRYADSVKFVNNKAYVEFTKNRLNYSENTIYVENIADYSNNKMKSDEVKVTPVLDKTSPEVVNYTVAEDGRSIKVFFSKNVDGKNKSNYTITDRNNRNVTIRDIQGSGREFTITLFSVLPIGENTLSIQGVLDTTPTRNPIVAWSSVIDMKDVEKSKVISSLGYGNNIVIEFSKPMDFATVSNPNNYYIYFNNKIMFLPSDTIFSPGNDGKTVTMQLPEEINNTKVMVGASKNITSMDIWGLKDITGNDTDPLQIKLRFDGESSGKAKLTDYYYNQPGKQGVLSEEDVIKVKFSVPIVQADKSDFTISGRTISSVSLDLTNEVTIYLDSSENTGTPTLSLKTKNDMKTYIDTGVVGGTISLIDEVAPRIKSNVNYLNTSGSTILLPFTEELEAAGASLYGRDLEVIKLSDGELLREGTDYTTSIDTDKSVLRITIRTGNISSGYSVRLIDFNSGKAAYIRDLQGNFAISYGEAYNTK
jgi:hypothetical protein